MPGRDTGFLNEPKVDEIVCEETVLSAGPLQILIVEDEAAHAEAIRRAFQKAGTTAVIERVGTLREYRAWIAARTPDIALVDLNLPDGRGVELLESHATAGAFPMLIMTSYGNEQIAVEALKAGALDYVVKSAGTFAAMPRVVARALRQWTLLREHREAERILRQSERRFRAVTRLCADFAYSCLRDEAGHYRVDWLTDTFHALTGFSEAEVREHRDWWFVVHPEDRERFLALLGRLEPGQTTRHEFRAILHDGEIRWFAQRMACEAESGAPDRWRIIGAVRDTTEWKGAARL